MSAAIITETVEDAAASDFDLDIRTRLRDVEDGDGAMEAKTVSLPNGPDGSSNCLCTLFFCNP